MSHYSKPSWKAWDCSAVPRGKYSPAVSPNPLASPELVAWRATAPARLSGRDYDARFDNQRIAFEKFLLSSDNLMFQRGSACIVKMLNFVRERSAVDVLPNELSGWRKDKAQSFDLDPDLVEPRYFDQVLHLMENI